MSKIANARAVLNNGKAIKSTDRAGNVTWFSQNTDGAYICRTSDGKYISTTIKGIQRNVEHDETTVESVPVADAPFRTVAEK